MCRLGMKRFVTLSMLKKVTAQKPPEYVKMVKCELILNNTFNETRSSVTTRLRHGQCPFVHTQVFYLLLLPFTSHLYLGKTFIRFHGVLRDL